jgi:hypothetical protein
VYQEILASHLGVDPREVLGQTFEPLALVRTPVSRQTSPMLVAAAG